MASSGVEISLKGLANVLKDTNGEIKKSGKCVLLVDHTERAGTFLQYQHVNYLNALSESDMAPERLRLAVVGGLRFGKPVVLDLMDLDTFPVCRKRMDEVQAGLMDSILDLSIRQDEKITPLIRDTDTPEYDINQFADSFKDEFNLFVVTTKQDPSEELLNNFYVVRIC